MYIKKISITLFQKCVYAFLQNVLSKHEYTDSVTTNHGHLLDKKR